MAGIFTLWKLANAVNRSFLSGEPVAKHVPALHRCFLICQVDSNAHLMEPLGGDVWVTNLQTKVIIIIFTRKDISLEKGGLNLCRNMRYLGIREKYDGCNVGPQRNHGMTFEF